MPRARRSTSASVQRVRVLVDSGAWIALVRARDGRHHEAEALFRRAIRERVELITTNLIVAEVQRFVLFHAGPRPAALVLERIHASPHLDVEFATRAQHDGALRWLAKLSDQHLTYTDAVSFAVMEERKCAAVMSFDSDFSVAGFTFWAAAE